VRREADFFGEQELHLVYMARRLKESLSVERALDAGGMDYTVDPAYYQSGLLFRSTKIGAYFYVLPRDEERARSILTAGGFKPYNA
jgi:hypothetical protein